MNDMSVKNGKISAWFNSDCIAVGNGLFVTTERPKERQFPAPVLYIDQNREQNVKLCPKTKRN